MDTGIKPWYEGMQSVNREQIGRQQAQTGLIELQRLKEAQAAEAAMMQEIQRNPALAQQLFGTIASLPTTGGPPAGGGAITQSPLGGGPAQQIPAYPDASRFAQVSPTSGGPIPPDVMGQVMPTTTPPQSVLGSLGPQGQGGMPGPQNPVLEMARTNPRAALMLSQQLEGRQDAAVKRQEQQLTMGTKVMEYLGRGAQGVTDQASLDAFRQDAARVHPQAAAQLPQVYSKEAMAPFIAKAVDVKDSLLLQVEELKAQSAVIKARKEGRSTDVDNQLRAMGVQPGQETPGQMKEALQAVQEGKIAVSASHGTGQLVQTPQGIVRVNPRTGNVDPVEAPGGGPMYPKPTAEEQRAASYGDRAKAAHDTAVTLEEKGLTPGIWSKVGEALPFGLGNYLVGEDQQRYRQTVNQFAQAILRKESGAAISPTEYTMTERTYFPQPGDSKKVIDQKRQERERVIQSMQEEGKQTGRTGTQAQPQGQAPAATGGTATTAWLQQMAKKYGLTLEQARQKAAAAGVKVE